jgi:hypothetical protein
MSSDGDFKNKPLKIYEPMNLIVFLSLYSPVILSIVVLSSSFIDKNWNGIIFICFLLGATFLRTFFYTIYDRQIHNAEDPLCNSVNYSVYGNSSFSVFVFTFFIVYIAVPMFLSKNINIPVFTIAIAYGLVDFYVKMFKKCFVNFVDVLLNVLLGLVISLLISGIMYNSDSGRKYLWFSGETNDESSGTNDGTKCSMPTNQTFKCRVYKNGELLSNT